MHVTVYKILNRTLFQIFDWCVNFLRNLHYSNAIKEIKLKLTVPLLNGRLFCVHLISVSGTEPSTMHVRLYCIPVENIFCLFAKLTDVGLTAKRAFKSY